jgi:hypothetical protein
MSDFAPPGAQWAIRARTALFGTDFRGHNAYLTPFAHVYRHLVANADSLDGWWTSAAGPDGSLYVHVPQGTAMLDAVYALRPGSQITFIGLAGSLAGHPVGTVLEPRAANVAPPLQANIVPDQALRTHSAPTIAATAYATSVSCLAESTQRHRELAAYADCVDMETGHLFAAARDCGHTARSLLVVSDSNTSGAVFTSDFAAMQAAFDHLCDLLICADAHDPHNTAEVP